MTLADNKEFMDIYDNVVVDRNELHYELQKARAIIQTLLVAIERSNYEALAHVADKAREYLG